MMEYEPTLNRFLGIPGVTRKEAEAAAKILCFNISIREQTLAEQMMIASLHAKLTNHDPKIAVAHRALAEAAEVFVEFVRKKHPSLKEAEAVEAAAILLNSLSCLFDSSPDLLQCMDEVVEFIRERK